MGSSVEILGSRSIQGVLVGGCAPFASVAWSRLRRSLLSLKHAPDTIRILSSWRSRIQTHASWRDAILGSADKKVPVSSAVKIVPIGLVGRKDKYMQLIEFFIFSAIPVGIFTDKLINLIAIILFTHLFYTHSVYYQNSKTSSLVGTKTTSPHEPILVCYVWCYC